MGTVWWQGAEDSSNIGDRQRPSGGSSGSASDSANQNNQNRERQWDPKADDWAKDVSYSTKDVRSSPQGRQDFRDRITQGGGTTASFEGTGMSPAERIARVKAKISQDNKYLTEGIWNPKGLSYDEQLKIAKEGERLLEYYNTDKYGYQNLPWDPEDWSTFFDPLKGQYDISDPGFSGTSKGWYGGYDTGMGGGSLGGPGFSGYGGDYGGGGGGGGSGGWGGGGGGVRPPEKFMPQGNAPDIWDNPNSLQQAMISIHGGQEFQQGFARGGIVSLVT